MVYHGPRERLLPHFTHAGYVCPPLYNPADFFMDLVAVDVRSEKMYEKSMSRVEDLIGRWKNCKALAEPNQDEGNEKPKQGPIGG